MRDRSRAEQFAFSPYKITTAYQLVKVNAFSGLTCSIDHVMTEWPCLDDFIGIIWAWQRSAATNDGNSPSSSTDHVFLIAQEIYRCS